MNLIIIVSAKYLFLASISILIFYLVYLWKKDKVKFLSVVKLSVVSFPLSYIIAKISGYIIHDPRPFVVEHVKPLIAHAADNGFPSDHTLLTMAIASVVFTYNKRLGIVLFILALLVGIARILALLHHPLDILGSTAIAVGATYLTFKSLKTFLLKNNKD